MDTTQRSGELWQKTFNHSPVGIAIVSTNGKFETVNPALCSLLGYTEEELLKFRWQDLTYPEDLLQVSALIFDIATSDRDQFKINVRYVRKDKSLCAVILMVSAIRDLSGSLQYLLSQSLDISEVTRLKAINKFKLTPELKTDILIALQQKEFYLEYEPIVSMRSLSIVGHEGLIRWKHSLRGMIAPLEWIPACEEDILLMTKVCSYVVEQGLIDARRRDTWVSVNISPVSLQSYDFWRLLSEVVWIGDSPIVHLEVTERVPFDFAYLEKLQALGYGIFLDDFGQGYSSLIQLARMFNILARTHFKVKIDGWFSETIEDKNTQAIVAELLDMFHRMGLEAIAECIETETQLKIWQDLGVDYGQGWYWKS